MNNPLPAGLSLKSSIAPVTGLLNFPAQEGDVIQTWNATSRTYVTHEFISGVGWDPPLYIHPGEAFRVMVAQPKNWIQQFTVEGTEAPEPPVIARQPQSRTNQVGTTATFAVVTTGTAPLSYQWRKNGTNLVNGGQITGATSTNLSISGLQPSDAGTYSVVVSNSFGQVGSSNAVLIVLSQPGLCSEVWGGDDLPSPLTMFYHPSQLGYTKLAQWADGLTFAGNYLIYLISASCPVSVDAIRGSDGGYLYTTPEHGSYSGNTTQGSITGPPDGSLRTLLDEASFVAFYNTGGWTNITVIGPNPVSAPVIAVQPQSQSADSGDTVTFTVATQGLSPVSYQWRFNGADLMNGGDISGVATPSLTLANVQTNHAGQYSVVVGNSFGVSFSSNAVLTVAASAPVDEQGIRALISALKSRAEAHDLDGFLALFATEYVHGGRNQAALRQDLQSGLSAVQSFDFSIERIEGAGSKARVHGSCTVVFSNGQPSSTWMEPATGDAGLGMGWLKKTTTGWQVMGNQDRARVRVQTVGGSGASGGGMLRLRAESELEISSVTVSGPDIAATPLEPDAFWGGFLARVYFRSGAIPQVGTEYMFDVHLSDGTHQVLRDTVKSWVLVGPTISVTTGAGTATIHWTDVRAEVPNAAHYWVRVSGDGVYWDSEDIPLSRTSIPFNEDGGATGSLQSGSRYYVRVYIFNWSDDCAEVGSEFTMDGSAGEAPTITGQPQNQTVTCGKNVVFAVQASGTAPLAYQWYFNTNTALVNATNSSLTVSNAQVSDGGGYSVVVSNDYGSVTSSNAALTIVSSNTAPRLTVPPDQTVAELTTLVVTNTATDADVPANVLTFGLVAAPSGVQLNPATGVLTWTPTEAQGPSTNTISVVATDDGVPPLSATNSITVIVREVNRPPELASIPDQYVHARAKLTLAVEATDPDLPANALTFDVVAGPSGLAIDPVSGLLTWTPTNAAGLGTNAVTVRVTDFNPAAANEQALSATQSLTIVVRELQLQVVRASDGLTLSLATVAGQTYRLESCDDLGQQQWAPVSGRESISGNGDSVNLALPVGGDRQKYYRIVLVP